MRARPPYGPLTAAAIGDIAQRALRRAGVVTHRAGAHTFRHTAGVQLVSAGVDITVIRSFLGHVSLDTTNHYARANIETKRRAIELVDRSTRPAGPPRWKRNPNLLNWLDSL